MAIVLQKLARSGVGRAKVGLLELAKQIGNVSPACKMMGYSRKFPPVRGWILQQVVKLAAVAASKDDVVLVADSDLEFVRPATVETFVRDGVVRFYRKPRAVDERLRRHMAWHRTARVLLGLPPAEPPYTDYISSLPAYDPAIVRRMLARVTAASGRP